MQRIRIVYGGDDWTTDPKPMDHIKIEGLGEGKLVQRIKLELNAEDHVPRLTVELVTTNFEIDLPCEVLEKVIEADSLHSVDSATVESAAKMAKNLLEKLSKELGVEPAEMEPRDEEWFKQR